jgi:acetolactate synthase regulatory subunit
MSSVAFAVAETQQPAAARFSVQARAEPGVLPRVLELFAKRGLVPRRWLSTRTGPDGAALTIDIEVAELEAETVNYVANCMRQIAGVDTVLTA